jgi:GLPGLI family protein
MIFTVLKTLPKYLIFCLIPMSFATCKRKPAGEAAEGRIEFRITYDREEVGGYSASVLPRKMIMEFSDNMMRSTIEGGLGFFSLVNISDLRTYQHTTWLKFIDKKYIYMGEKRESPCCFGMLSGMNLQYTDSTKEIVGLNCRHVVASFPENGIESFDIWYTEEIDVDNPNSNSPFNDIPGVLLEFNTLMGNANMHMIATSYNAQKIPQKLFQIPKNYREVTKAEIEGILETLMN